MKQLFTALTLIAAFTALSCTKGGTLERNGGSQYTITSTAGSKQLVPAIDTTATGTLKGFYDESLNIFTFTLTWNDLWRTTGVDTIVAVNFYGPASPAQNGALVRSLPFASTNSASGINLGLAGGTGFSNTEKKYFLEGNYYYTINTKKFPNGIIRGQLAAAKQ